ncbi:HD domain-containing protein [Desulfomonile tiedjei]|uniref:HD superfamily phosphohydrolase n=1 Tax=Desulfomonile tiedjei (strain ATCC 49306 / DSM 6799 / DCB-1) TaxID=706587 RepID=I4BZY2_DESTA|nr:HD domain-containing protein [Desulfomonile tiedjei]AFM22873.1 HD superfamily phosphohydrolase [Desulfomonile tiedjei DSM 6799]
MKPIRDPIHGFIELNEWEQDIINHPLFQRLRRIRQLAWTDMVYPGALHTRFEHSLGVMHVATRMFKNVRLGSEDILKNDLNYTDGGLDRVLALIRISCLLHDIGHGPFSHAAEELMPISENTGKPYDHESYSAEAVTLMEDIINHRTNERNYGITTQDIKEFLNGEVPDEGSLLWRRLLSSQLDADRVDYLLRDSHHIGVAYGRYDLDRLVSTLTVAIDPETDAPVLAIEEGGLHAAEGFILARYMMFTQVYFHKTRRAYDFHFSEAMRSLLDEEPYLKGQMKGRFPAPNNIASLKAYFQWTDWRVLGLLEQGKGGYHGEIIRRRKHFKKVYATKEVPDKDDLERAEEVCQHLGDKVGFVDRAEQSWYKFLDKDIPVLQGTKNTRQFLTPLSKLSSVVNGLKSVNQIRIYVSEENRKEAEKIIEALPGRGKGA